MVRISDDESLLRAARAVRLVLAEHGHFEGIVESQDGGLIEEVRDRVREALGLIKLTRDGTEVIERLWAEGRLPVDEDESAFASAGPLSVALGVGAGADGLSCIAIGPGIRVSGRDRLVVNVDWLIELTT